jgi:hypothetical protein
MNSTNNNDINNSHNDKKYELDYDKFIILDAEELAEGSIERSYKEISEIIHIEYGIKLKEITPEICESYYSVNLGGKSIIVYNENQFKNDDIWKLATEVFFSIINSQLNNLEVKLYAINGGNELGGYVIN